MGSCFIRNACLQFWAELDQMKSAAYWWWFNLEDYPSVAKSEGLFRPNGREHLENQRSFMRVRIGKFGACFTFGNNQSIAVNMQVTRIWQAVDPDARFCIKTT